MRTRPPSWLSLTLLILPMAVQAETLEEPRSLAMGGAIRGDPVANSAVIGNPAGMSRGYTYAAEAGYFRTGNDSRNAGVTNIVDSKTQPTLAVGVAYAYEWAESNAPVSVTGHNARLAFSHAVSPNRFNLGVGLHYIRFDREIEGGEATDLDGFTLDIGAHFSLTSDIHVGLVGQNIIDLDDPEFPRMAGGGVAYTGPQIALDVDVVMDFDTQKDPKPVYMAGTELLLGEVIPLRAGFQRNDATEKSYVSGGLGFMSAGQGSGGSQLSIAYRQNIEDSKDFHFGVGLTMFM